MDEQSCLIVNLKNKKPRDITLTVESLTENDDCYGIIFNNTEVEYRYKKSDVFFCDRPLSIDVQSCLVKIGKGFPRTFVQALRFGKWVKFFPEKGRLIIAKYDQVQIIEDKRKELPVRNLFDYFTFMSSFFEIKDDKKGNNNYLQKQYENIGIVHPDSVLAKYLSGNNVDTFALPEEILFPFGLNPSQKSAVEKALTNQISIIEGPPGTGKTQTILNIIANALSKGQSIGIVAGNNSATDNVFEKLEAKGFSFIAASLGNKERKDSFFEKDYCEPDLSLWALDNESFTGKKALFKQVSEQLTKTLDITNKQAELKQEKNDLLIEYKHFKNKYPSAINIFHTMSLNKSVRSSTVLRFKQFLEMNLRNNGKLSLLSLVFSFLNFGIYRLIELYKIDASFIANLQKDFFDARIKELNHKLEEIQNSLLKLNSKELMAKSESLSGELFKHYIYKNRAKRVPIKFAADNFKFDFDQFIKQHPLILSTTNSIKSCMNSTALLDYLIIDEASQVDLVTGALAMSCCKRLVVVGDMKQIANFPQKEAVDQKESIKTKFNIDPNYDYFNHSIMSSLIDIYGDKLSKTMLREHYRCHPAIIGFCNKQFYNNELLVMTEEDNRDDPFLIYSLKEGNHARKLSDAPGLCSEREIAVIKDEVLEETRLITKESSDIGIIAPYRRHIERAREAINDENLDTDTVYKFQGREKSVIIFSTVANSINDFIDRPDTVNVAVSRAVDQFVLVTGNKIFQDANSNIGALIRYVNYQTLGKALIPSKKSSVFDLLYTEQSKQRRKFLKDKRRVSLYDSENLVDRLLEDVLKDNEFSDLNYVLHVQLNDVVKDVSNLTKTQRIFVEHPWTHLDFVVFSRIDKAPVLAIEVDGFEFHENNKQQQKRDEIKNQVLQSIGLRILRLKTNECDEKERIIASLQRAAKRVVIKKDDTSDQETWDKIKNLVDEDVVDLISILSKAKKIPLPVVGYELSNELGAGIAEAELAWEARKIALLLDYQLDEGQSVFIKKGWQVFTLDTNQTMLIEALKEI